MSSVIEKIEEAARARLVLPPGRSPSEEKDRYRRFLELESQRLKMWHRSGASGRQICAARTRMIDLLLQHLMSAFTGSGTPAASGPGHRFAVVATGGYGRGELNPCSDLDIMLLTPADGLKKAVLQPFLELIEGGLLWDIGLKVGHATRSLADCVTEANQDMQSKTSLIEARPIWGDEALFARLQQVVVRKCVDGHEEEYIAARIADQEARRAKFGNSACMQEPHVKNGCGGLRDYQNLLWMAFFKYRSRSLADLELRELINASERRQLEQAYDFLLRVRNELHYHCRRPQDVLQRDLQPTIAQHLGYTDRSPKLRLEKFMHHYYIQARQIYLLTRNLEQRLALLPQPRRLPTWRQFLRDRRARAQYVVDGFKFVDGQVLPASPRVFRDQPRRLMRVFRHAQQRGLRLHPDTAQLIRNHLQLAHRGFSEDPHVRDTFLEILNQRGNVAPILRAMHEVGLLGKYLPAFGRLTCLVQHEFYHLYAADEHTLMCLEVLDRIWGSTEPRPAPYAELFQKLERPFILYLALLLHDVGKGIDTDDHTTAGRRVALDTGARLGLDETTRELLGLLVQHHVLMAQLSQRRDLDDDTVIRGFAETVRTEDTLAMLTLHTFADSLATSDQLWNGFKDTLLWTLHHRTVRVLDGSDEFQRVEAAHKEDLARQVRTQTPQTIGDDELAAHFADLPPRYFRTNTPRQIAEDVALAHRFMHHQLLEQDRALEPVISWHHEPDRGYSVVKICTWDRARLFSKLAGAFTASALNILSADIFTRPDRIVLDSFAVTDAATGAPVNRDERERFERLATDALTRDVDLAALLAKARPRRSAYRSLENERLPIRIRFDNQASTTYTVIDVEAEDRVGLLYAISQVLADLDLDIGLARINTEKGAAMDTFYVRAWDGGKLLTDDIQQLTAHKLRTAIARLEQA